VIHEYECCENDTSWDSVIEMSGEFYIACRVITLIYLLVELDNWIYEYL